MRLSARLFLLVALAVFSLMVGGYLYLLVSVIGSPVQSDEYWTRAIYDYKQYAASEIKEPKLIILSGSNGMFGVDTALLEQSTGRKAVNMAIHGDLDISFLYQQLKDTMKEGDWVVMPLEYEYYLDSHELSLEFVSSMVAWGKDIYIDRLSPVDYLQFLVAVPKMRVFAGLVQKDVPKILRRGQNKHYKNPETAINEVLANNRNTQVRFNGYTHFSLSERGDIDAPFKHQKNVLGMARKGEEYLPPGYEISPRFIDYFHRIKELVEGLNGKVMLTWPVSIRNPLFNLMRPDDQQRVEDFTEQLEGFGIRIDCHPAYFNLDYRLFFDTSYHLNMKGKSLRTKRLLQCMQAQGIGMTVPPHESAAKGMRWSEILPKVRKQELDAIKGKVR